MKVRFAFLISSSLLLAACNTSSTGSGIPSAPDSDAPTVERGIVGEWNLKETDSVLSCRVKVSGKNQDREGRATGYGCIGLDNFLMVDRWKREKGRVEFYSFAYDGPVASVYRVSRDEFQGELLPSGRDIIMKRR